MAYDEDFFRRYVEYAQEPVVRSNHQRAFLHLRRLAGVSILDVVDLGCGIGEYYHHGLWNTYVGVDIEPRLPKELVQFAATVKADYHAISAWTDGFTHDYTPSAFVSLFSIEPAHNEAARERLYRRLFNEVPSLQYGMSAGFYYAEQAEREEIEETGGIVSYQTIDRLLVTGRVARPFNEERLVMHTPSKMFGEDVIEVWKFFTRRSKP